MVVYSSDDTGIYRVGWKILNYYQAEGGPTSRLGFPISGIAVVEKKGFFSDVRGRGRLFPIVFRDRHGPGFDR